ncbi:MAG: lysylphosphatidylglycerol synthase transmembrane domain-containing protein, partial [Acidimicrobiales bacterium]
MPAGTRPQRSDDGDDPYYVESSVVAGASHAAGDHRHAAIPPSLHSREHPVHPVPPDPPIVAPSAGRWYRIWRLARYAFALAALGAAVYAVSGRTDELNGATTYLARLRWEWLVVAVGAEAVSFIAYAALQRRLLLAGKVDVPMTPMTGISVAANAIQNSLPGGIVFYAAYNLRQYHRFGADDVLSVWTLIALNAVSFICLSGLAAVGLAMALSAGSAYDLIEAILGIVIVAVLLVIAWYERAHLLPHAARAVRLSQRLAHRPDPALTPTVVIARWLDRVAAIDPSRRDWARAVTMSVCNWLADCACLALSFIA